MSTSYFSLSVRVPEVTSLEPLVLARLYAMIARLPLVRSVHRRFLAGALAQGATRGLGLDLGTGPGYVAMAIAQYQPGLQMVGLDLSAHMLKQARRQSARAELDGNAFWPQADGAHLPFRDKTFDLVISAFSLHHWRDPLQILNEIARVLAPEGQYIIADLSREPNLLQRMIAYASIPAISLPFGSYRGYGGYYESVRAAYTRDEAQDLIEKSALPAGVVETDSTPFVPVLVMASQPWTQRLAGDYAIEPASPKQRVPAGGLPGGLTGMLSSGEGASDSSQN